MPRYTGRPLKDFTKYILLTNFEYYLELFSEIYQVPIVGEDKTMPSISCNGITLINFGMGSPNAATVIDLLSAVEPEAVLFIGKCGGIKAKNSVGDYILPIAAIKGEGTSDDYLPHEVPALPAFSIQKHAPKPLPAGDTTTTRESYTPPTAGYGNMTTGSRIPEKHAGHGRRHGDSHHLHRRLRQPHPDRSFTPGVRPPDDFGRDKNSRIG